MANEAYWKHHPMTLKCYMCLPADQRMSDEGPDRKVISSKTVNPTDPTEAYTLECGHTII